MVINLAELGPVWLDPNNTYIAITPMKDTDDYVDIYLEDFDIVIVTYIDAFINYLNNLHEEFAEMSVKKYLNLIINDSEEVAIYEGELPEFITLTEYLLFEHN